MVFDDHIGRGRALRIAVGILMLGLLMAGSASAATQVSKVEIRGTVATGSGAQLWDAQSFAGFCYDLKYDKSTETLNLFAVNTRTIEKDNLWYNTTIAKADFKVYEKNSVTVNSKSNYPVVGWQAEKWIAINNKANKIAKLAYEMSTEDKKTLVIGETWVLGAGYVLTINDINARTTPRRVWFTLKKDGEIVDEVIGQAPMSTSISDKQKAVYFKARTILGESDALLFTVYIDTILSDAITDMVQFKYAWLIDESSAKEIKAPDYYGVFEVRIATSASLNLSNENTFSLSRNSESTLMGNMKFRIADNDTLRYYPYVEYTTPGTYELRGKTANSATNPPGNILWNAQTFTAFSYNLKYDISTESLILVPTLENVTRTIEKDNLWYNTTISKVNFNVNEKENVTVNSKSNYPLVGWQAEKWIAIKDKANKIAKLAFEMGKEDLKTLTTGETWSLGAGYELTINAIDARTNPRQVWFTLKKDGAIVDEGIGQAPATTSVADKEKAVYYKTKTIMGESDALLFTVYIDTIFSGATSDMVQFRYAWLIDESSAREIKSGDKFGIFEVRAANPDYIMMTNEEPVSLSSNTETTLMGDIKFRIADDSNVLRLYPKVDYTIGDRVIPPTGPVHNINKGINYTTIKAAVNDASPDDEIRVDSGTYYENVNVTKRLILRGIGMPVVDARGSGSVITLAADGITLEGFTATGGGAYSEAGIKITSNNNTLIGNIINSNIIGIYLDSSSSNTLSGNTANNNDRGIQLSSSRNNNVSGNTANFNSEGIRMNSASTHNLLIGNTANSNFDTGIRFLDSSENTLQGNSASNNINSGIELDGGCINNTLSSNNASNNSNGIRLSFSNNDNNTLSGNTVNSNLYNGIALGISTNNKMYNNFLSNINNAQVSTNNIWNLTKTAGVNIIGGPYLGGNFWANPGGTGFSQTCIDSDKDGICDAQYTLDSNNIDYLPLAKNMVGLPKNGDINGNGQITLVDAIYLAKHVGGFNGYEVMYADVDINANGQVTLVDAIYLAKHVGGFIGYEKIY